MSQLSTFFEKITSGVSRLRCRAGLYQDDWFSLVVKSLDDQGLKSPHGDPLPGFPSATLQANTTGLDGVAALHQAFCFYQDVLAAIEACGAGLTPKSQVLDFGVGWGRITRFFLRDVPLKNLHGIDVDPEFVTLCRTLFNSENFHTCEPLPPTALPAGSFDLITAYSVYSHLSGEACTAWLAEFRRLLKPGGCVAFTTRHESFFNYLEQLRDQRETLSGYSRALGELFPDIADARARHARGELVHASSAGVSGGGVRNESYYGETFIPVDYIRSHFTDGFDLVGQAFDSRRFDQVLFILRKQ